jgi:gliding motility-associated protein GldM
MGAKNCPETPRQKLIGMMYLVLTALLALNVSKEILDAFVVVNESLVTTNENFQKKVDGLYDNFAKQAQFNPGKVGPYYQKALQAKKYTDELVTYIEQIRTEVISKEAKMPLETAKTIDIGDVAAKDKYDEGTHYFIGDSQDGSKGKAREMRLKIEEFKKNMIALVDPQYHQVLKLGLNTEGPFLDADKKEHNWEMHHFYHTILAANVVILNKIIADVKNAEYDVVNTILTSVSVEDFKFDQIQAKVVPKSNYVLTGESFEADIFVAALDTKQNPEIIFGSAVDSTTGTVSGGSPVDCLNGVGKLKVPAGGQGIRQYGGIIKVPTASGVKVYPFSGEYVVAAPSATISPTKMNVFYIGVDNPVSISVPGVPNEKVNATISGGGGSISKTGNGQYNVKVSSVGDATVNVSANMGGSSRNMGSMKFRVKRVPDPAAYIANVKGGPVSKGALLASASVIPKMENFDFDLYFTVTSFSLTMNIQGDLITKSTAGNKLSAEMVSMVNKAGRGQKIYIEDIKAKGPDGTTRTLAPINLKIN